MNPLESNPDNIWSYPQNRCMLVAQDLHKVHDVPIEDTLRVLVSRGVSKWLAVRRDLIRLKDEWKAEVTASLTRQRQAKNHDVVYERGYRAALIKCRAEVRALCHSERWRCSDLDPELQKLLEQWSQDER